MNGKMRLLICSLILTFIAAPVLAQNVLLPQTSSTPSTAAVAQSPQNASPTTQLVQNSTTPAPVSLDNLLAKNSSTSSTQQPDMVYLPANIQAGYAQAEIQKINMLEQVLHSVNQATANRPTLQKNMSSEQYTQILQTQDQQAASIKEQITKSQQRLAILEGGAIKLSDVASLYSY